MALPQETYAIKHQIDVELGAIFDNTAADRQGKLTLPFFFSYIAIKNICTTILLVLNGAETSEKNWHYQKMTKKIEGCAKR